MAHRLNWDVPQMADSFLDCSQAHLWIASKQQDVHWTVSFLHRLHVAYIAGVHMHISMHILHGKELCTWHEHIGLE